MQDHRPPRFTPLTDADMARLKADLQRVSWPAQVSDAWGVSETRATEFIKKYSRN